MKECPKCGADLIFSPLTPALRFDGTFYGGRLPAFCNTTNCDQRYWWYPQTGRITRRNKWKTYQEWRVGVPVHDPAAPLDA